mmetsp:Transcript_46231/g.107051  ORF Transcript_46231/g.107051 Transcript_46231/m.107051 type:complete len:134 (+) Transcript_46231:56-457(+)
MAQHGVVRAMTPGGRARQQARWRGRLRPFGPVVARPGRGLESLKQDQPIVARAGRLAGQHDVCPPQPRVGRRRGGDGAAIDPSLKRTQTGLSTLNAEAATEANDGEDVVRCGGGARTAGSTAAQRAGGGEDDV